ncbi:MAG: hypothetical protein ACOYIK_03895 [Coriobacteriales bacterium]|jgi:hypothetical protein
MVKLMGIISGIAGILLAVAPLVFGMFNLSMPIAAVGVACGVVAAICGFCMTSHKTAKSLAWVNVVLGIVALIDGIIGLVMVGTGWSLILWGCLLTCIDAMAVPFMIETKKAQFFNKTGNDLAKVTSVKMKNGQILAKATLLGSMPETIYVRPGELIKMVALIDDGVAMSLLGFIRQGYKDNKAEAAKSKDAESRAAK